MSSPKVHLYTAQSPNGHKISITLEELGLPYEFTAVNMAGMAHKEPWFLAINPNGRIPAMTDSVDGEQVALFESGSIQMYLIDRYDQEHKLSYQKGSKEWYKTINWVCPAQIRLLSDISRRGCLLMCGKLFFQNAGVGPMQGQANHFVRYSMASEPIPYAVDRYKNETRRLYRTVDNHLEKTGSSFLVGEKMTIADIALWCWVNSASSFAL
jgi:glutathione S-transferase